MSQVLRNVAALAKAREIRAMHQVDRDGRCAGCDGLWPCDTAEVLDVVLAVAR